MLHVKELFKETRLGYAKIRDRGVSRNSLKM